MERGFRLLLLWDVNTKRSCYLILYLCVKTFEYCVDAFRATDIIEYEPESLLLETGMQRWLCCYRTDRQELKT